MSFAAKRPTTERAVDTLSDLVRGDRSSGAIVRITIDLDKALHKRLKVQAALQEESLADLIRAMIVKFVETEESVAEKTGIKL
ncbi:MAG: hypothetical protein ACRDAM_13995 [Casimicrobium sp.]